MTGSVLQGLSASLLLELKQRRLVSWSLVERCAPKYCTPMNAPPTTSIRTNTSPVN